MKTRKTRIPSKTSSTLSPAAFLEAARMIGEGEEKYACLALDEVSRSGEEWANSGPECLWFNAVLKPEHESDCSAWYGTARNSYSSVPCGDAITARIIGLCLCAELLKDGFDPYTKD